MCLRAAPLATKESCHALVLLRCWRCAGALLQQRSPIRTASAATAALQKPANIKLAT
jgi:hypothetical protein